MDIYAPLAERIGMYEYMREMQLLAFRELEPEAYATITGRLAKLTAGGKDKVTAISREFKDLLAKKRHRGRRVGAARSIPIRSGARCRNATSASNR